jgi:hypothetical protein
MNHGAIGKIQPPCPDAWEKLHKKTMNLERAILQRK